MNYRSYTTSNKTINLLTFKHNLMLINLSAWGLLYTDRDAIYSLYYSELPLF